MVAPLGRRYGRKSSQVSNIFFQSVNMKNCGRRIVRKHKEIKGSNKCVTLNISKKFYSLNKMETTSSESKEKIGGIRKGVGNRSGSQDQHKVGPILLKDGS